MKKTGMVRKLDDLGRIVIPKEIRKSMQIKEGSELEIVLNENGNIELNKFNSLNSVWNFAKDFSNIIFEIFEVKNVICDLNNILIVSGISKKDFVNKQICEFIKEKINTKQNTYLNDVKLIDDNKSCFDNAIIIPIIVYGEVLGAIVCVDTHNSEQMTQICKLIVSFFQKQMS